MVYADNSASQKPLQCALEAFMNAPYGNPDSTHSVGRTARKSLENSRRIIAECIGAESEEIYFCSGGTEANNIVIQSMAKECRVHSWKTSHVSARPEGIRKVPKEPVAVSMPYINNETGVISGREYGTRDFPYTKYVHMDAVAAVGQYPVNVKKLGCDYLTAAGHKFGAPIGIGFIYAKKDVPLFPLFFGGEQESFVRPGTPSVALAAAMAAALKYRTDTMEDAQRNMARVNGFISQTCSENIRFFHNNATDFGWRTAPHIMSVRIEGIPSVNLLPLLDAQEVYCSAGSACSAGSRSPSRVLMEEGLSATEALETIRISISPETTIEQAKELCLALRSAAKQYRTNRE